MRRLLFGLVFVALLQSPGLSAESPGPPAYDPAYADLADLAVPAAIVAHVRIRSAIPLKKEAAAGVPVEKARYYVEATLVSLLRAPDSLPADLSYLVDLPRDPEGKAPKLRRKEDYLVFAAPVAGRPGELRLLGPATQLLWTEAREAQVLAIVREASKADAPPAIVGIGKAFHVAGSLPGEGETQLFLLTADGRPVSLSILRRPGQEPSWAVALGDIVDEAADPPQRDTLLWYRLACTLPQALPAQTLADAQEADAAAIRADYALVLDRLGPCVRRLPRA